MTLVAGTNAGIGQRIQSDSVVRAAAPRESHEATRRMDPIWELFSSERMYARDLALVCNIHLPLAQGKPISKPDSSTLCSGSGFSPPPASGFAPSNSLAHPMTDDDVRSIFRNISDIASLSSRFVERLETIFNRQTNEGGSDEDNVGKLFLDIIADLEPLYKTYLSTHSAALSRLQRFSQSPANQNYTSIIQSHLPPGTPDLASFLEKPKERIPEYCHLLHSIISHRDLTALTQARDQMERVARKLRNDKSIFPSSFSLKIPTISIRTVEPASTGADDLAQLENRLRQYPIFLDDLARHVEDLTVATRRSVELLQQWGIAFGAVTLGLGPSQPAPHPPAYPTFTSLLSTLLDLCNAMESDLHMTFIPPIKKLKAMTERPKQLLNEMHTLEHHTPSSPFAKIRRYFSKDRRRYTDLQSKLLVELPLLLDAMDRAIGLAIRIAIQVILEILERVRDKWMGFFNSMVEDDEHYGGVEETLKIWSTAWEQGKQKLMAWEEKYVLRELTERNVRAGRSEAGLPATPAEVPPASDVRSPAAPPDSGTKTSHLLSIFPQPATVRLPMKRRMTWPGLRAAEQNYRP